MRSTQRQVAALVAGSVLLAYLVTIGVVMVLRGMPQPGRAPDMRALRLMAGLYAAHPDMRPEMLQRAEKAGLVVREVPDHDVQDCRRATPPGNGAPGAPCVPPSAGALEMEPVRATAETWLAVVRRPPPALNRSRARVRLAILLTVMGLPTLAMSLWASRRVTAPLLRLTAQAERVDPEMIAAPLPVEGTTEIRLLAEAFNRLILRLTRYAAEQRRTLAAVSHDLRTPLTRLRLRAETIDDAAARALMVRDVDAMQVLIDHTLLLLQAQDRRAPCTKVDLSALLQTVADDMADAGVRVTLGTLEMLEASCNAPMMIRAVENVLDNAAKYAGGGTVGLYRRPGAAVIAVADQGAGLTPAEKSAVFEPWFRGDLARGGEGNGLGLTIVQALMAAQGGAVELADNLPSGLIVRLILPL